MSCQIKFRVWNGFSKKWEDRECFLNKNGNIYYFCNDLHQLLPLENYHIFQQFTGLFDKNGKEIYEGDILIYRPDYSESSGGQKGADIDFVHFDHATFFWGNKLKCALNEYLTGKKNTIELEVIGNIFENPELLTK